MPSDLLMMPHFQQEFEYSCVPACARIVLAYYGDVRTEAELRSELDTQPTGTRARNLMRLSGTAFEVFLRSSHFAELQTVLAGNQPVIVFLKTGLLEYWTRDIFHTAVLVGLDAESVTLLDPYLASGPQKTSLASFEKAWAQTGQFAGFIRPRTSS